MPRIIVSVALLLASAWATDNKESSAKVDKESSAKVDASTKRPSTLAPLIKYLDVWNHVHGKDTGIPKMLLLLDEEGAVEAPSWFSTAAMKYKEGRKKTVSFIAVKGGKDARNAATRFGLKEIPEGGALFACVPGRDGAGGFAKQLEEPLDASGAGARTRAVKAFVDGILAGVPEEERSTLPAFPEPTRPRKAAAVSLEEFTHETLPLRCYGVQAKPLCVFAVQALLAGEGCPASVGALAKRHANDPVSFGCVGGAKQGTFLSAYGLTEQQLPALVAVKAGKRPRFAKLSADVSLQAEPMNAFVDALLGGSASFKRLEELPDLEAPYLLDKDEV